MAVGGVGSLPALLQIDKRKDVDDFLRQLQDMRSQKCLTNYEIRAEDEKIACHKVVLAARSAYFRHLFNNADAVEVKQGFVELKSMRFSALQLVIDYCYSTTLELVLEDARDVIEVAEYLQVPALKDEISALIVKHVTIDNCIGWYFFADTFRMADVKEKAREVMYVDFSSVVKVPEFFALDYRHLVDYMAWTEVDCSGALIAAAEWALHDAQRRKENFHKVLNVLKLNSCSKSALKYVVDKYGSQLITSPEMKQQFLDAALGDVPEWQAAGRGAGYDIMVVGGLEANMQNKNKWIVNLKTRTVVEKAGRPGVIPNAIDLVMYVTSKGAFFADGEEIRNNGEGMKCVNDPSILYQTTENTWAHFPQMPHDEMPHHLECAGAVCMRAEKIFVLGGEEIVTMTKMYCFDLATNTWSACPDMLEELMYPVVGCVDHFIYVVYSTFSENENTRQGSEISMQCFDSTTEEWSFKSKLPEQVTGTAGASTVTVDHQMYVIGGRAKICLRYNSQTDTWTILAAPLAVRMHGAAACLKGRIILCGGMDADKKDTDSIESYDPTTDTWEMLSVKLPTPLRLHCIMPLQ